MTSRSSLWRKSQRNVLEAIQFMSSQQNSVIADDNESINSGHNSTHPDCDFANTSIAVQLSDSEVSNSEETAPGFSRHDVDIGSNSSDESFQDDNDVYNNIDETYSLLDDLRLLSIKHKLSRRAINNLLAILSKHGHEDLPKDSRTLLQSLRNVDVIQKSSGDYFYIGLKTGIERCLEFHPSFQGQDISLIVNIDGIPLFKSSSADLWPILARFNTFTPFAVALYFGSKKPESVEEFLEDFLIEYEELARSGVSINGNNYSVSIKCFSCDAPARSFLKCIKAHNAYSGCERCEVVGKKENKTTTFLNQAAMLRTDEKFKNMQYPDHQIRRSILVDYGISCVDGFVLDYMHLVLLGVTRRIVKFFFERDKKAKLSHTLLKQIGGQLENFRSMIPSDFNRRPRTLYEWKRWKATEWYQFLLYTGVVCLKNSLDASVYEHFLCLSIAIRILLHSDSTEDMIIYAHNLLCFFVGKASEIYGKRFVTYNVHNLIHLSTDVSKYKCSLHDISAFEFENYLQHLKKMVANGNNPIAQVVKKLSLIEKNYCEERRTNAPIIKENDRDGWFKLHSGEYCKIFKIEGAKVLVEVVPRNSVQDFFVQPCPSSDIGIVKVSHCTSFKRKEIEKRHIQRKVCCLKREKSNILIPLIDCYEW